MLNLGAAIGMKARNFWQRFQNEFMATPHGRHHIIVAMMKCAVETALRCMERHSVSALSVVFCLVGGVLLSDVS